MFILITYIYIYIHIYIIYIVGALPRPRRVLRAVCFLGVLGVQNC